MGCVGENLYIQNGPTPRVLYKVPLRECGLRGTKWTKGKCFPKMGKHARKSYSSLRNLSSSLKTKVG